MPAGQHLTLREFREKSERQYIVDTLRLAGWNISRTAILLGVERTNLHKKIRSYQIKRGERLTSRPRIEGRRSDGRNPSGCSAAGPRRSSRAGARRAWSRFTASPGPPASCVPCSPPSADAGHAVDAALLPGHGTGAERLQDVTFDEWVAASRGAHPRPIATHDRVVLLGYLAREPASPCRSPASGPRGWPGSSS